MPDINLKPNSPEYADSHKNRGQRTHRLCDVPDCPLKGEYKAPKDRTLKQHYWFCLEHVQDYNKAWNYFSGMSTNEMEDYINKATVWDRPTRRYDSLAMQTDKLRKKAWQTYHYADDEPPQEKKDNRHISRQTPEFEALSIMGLEPPITLDEIKAKYKILAKKYHPDLNKEDADAEELLKKINMAYTILKLSYQKYEAMQK